MYKPKQMSQGVWSTQCNFNLALLNASTNHVQAVLKQWRTGKQLYSIGSVSVMHNYIDQFCFSFDIYSLGLLQWRYWQHHSMRCLAMMNGESGFEAQAG